jgi:hypothetical protein
MNNKQKSYGINSLQEMLKKNLTKLKRKRKRKKKRRRRKRRKL